MKKSLILMLALLSLFLVSCEQDNGEQGEDGMIKENETAVIINNDVYEMTIKKNNGSITKLLNTTTQTDYVKETVGGNFSFLLDINTDNSYNTNMNNAIMFSSRDYQPEIKYEEENDCATLELIYNISKLENSKVIDGITVKNIFTFTKGDSKIIVNYELDNQTSFASNIISFTSLIISGIKDANNEYSLFWPNKEGKIYDNAVQQARQVLKLKEQYPSPISMQLVQLFSDKDALYYYVADNQREYKEFKFGSFVAKNDHDYGGVSIVDKVSLSCTQYPFLKSNAKAQLKTTYLGFSTEESWYRGADEYRDFLINSNMTKEYNTFTREWTGFIADTIAGYGDNMKKAYVGDNSSDKVIKGFDNSLVDTVVLFGWHQGGFDYKYPDYEFFEGANYGKNNFATLVNNAHDNGDYVLPYLNAHIIATNSKWGNDTFDNQLDITNMLNSAIKKQGYNRSIDPNNYPNYMHYETYGTDIGYYAACPASDEFLVQIHHVVRELASTKIDGLWMDQMMEMPAHLCYDSTHNHKTPATAYAEGYKRMYDGIHDIFDEHEIEALIFAEGVTDAWIEYIDIPGYMWARHLYAPDNVNPGDNQPMSPHITVYTLPAKFLGINSYKATVAHAHAFLFGSPINGVASAVDTEIRKVFIDNKDIYMYGRYMHKVGLSIENINIDSSIIISENGNFAINLYNASNDNQTVNIKLDLSKLALNDINFSKASELFSNDDVTYTRNGNIISLTINMIPAQLLGLRFN